MTDVGVLTESMTDSGFEKVEAKEFSVSDKWLWISISADITFLPQPRKGAELLEPFGECSECDIPITCGRARGQV